MKLPGALCKIALLAKVLMLYHKVLHKTNLGFRIPLVFSYWIYTLQALAGFRFPGTNYKSKDQTLENKSFH